MVKARELFSCAVVLTGSIATGKSTVARYLRGLGYVVIDVDAIAHDCLEMQKEALVALFGEHIIKREKIDRKALGAIVFSNKEARQRLEGMLHPLIYDEVLALSEIEADKGRLYFIDIPLYFETERYREIRDTLVVYTPQQLQLERLIQRENITTKEAQKRIALQINIEQKRAEAKYVLENSGTEAKLKVACQEIVQKIEREKRCL